MTRSTVVAGYRAYTVSDLEPRARGELFQAVVVAQLIDDCTGVPLSRSVRISGNVGGLLPRVAGSGFAGLAGVPTRVFPQLATSGYTVDVVIEADGHETRHEQVVFAQQPGFADELRQRRARHAADATGPRGRAGEYLRARRR